MESLKYKVLTLIQIPSKPLKTANTLTGMY